MRFLYSLFLIPVFFLFACKQQLNDKKTIFSQYSTSGIRLENSQDIWLQVDSVWFENREISDNTVSVKSLWDRDSLYFLFRVTDKTLRAFQTEKDHPKLFLDDMVEILIDANNDKNSCWGIDDFVYHINILGVIKDDRGTADCQSDPSWDGNACCTVTLFGTLNDSSGSALGYMVEIALPWTDINIQPHYNLKIGINFANGDNDGNGRQLFDWSGADPMRSPHAFGTLVLKE